MRRKISYCNMFKPTITSPNTQSVSAIAVLAIPLLMSTHVFETPPTSFELNPENHIILASSDVVLTSVIEQAPPVTILPTSSKKGHFANVGSGELSPVVGGTLRNLLSA
jgi:hypothetical protein